METETVKRPPKPKKIETVAELSEKIARARGIYFTENKGLKVAEITDLRRQCHQAGVEYIVAKNTFTRMAMDANGMGEVLPLLVGPTAVVFAYKDPAAPAKILFEYAAKNEKLVLKGGMFEGKAITPADISSIKDLPSREVALSMLVGAIYGPVQGFYNVVNAVLRDFVSVVDQIAEKKQSEAA